MIDRVVSSYTPTIRALIHARANSGATGHNLTSLVVALPSTPEAADLPGIQHEADLVHEHFPHGLILRQDQATHAAVIAAPPISTWAHFACHGYSDPDTPSRSHLLVYDHHERPLSVLDVSRLRLRQAEFAYLSACDTTRTSTEFADEAVHITAAFQLAGYPHVVGTMWTINDNVAVKVARYIYATLTDGKAEASRAAEAVHYATRQIRKRYPHNPLLWAAHIHAGI